MCRLNPKVDFAFKKLFASPENKDLLISFINSMLSEDEQISDIELKNPYNMAIDKEIKKALEKLDIMYLESEEREIYEDDLKAMRDYKAGLKTAERKGREEGIRQLILKQYAKGLDLEYIAAVSYTHLTLPTKA